MRDVRRVGVVVPARNEEDTIGACLDSIAVAASRVDAPVSVVVVVNGSDDETLTVVRDRGTRALVLDQPNVGAARHVGALEHLLAGQGTNRQDPVGPGGTWLAFTDADSLVPMDWLVTHLACAADGADAVLGTVSLPTEAMARHPRWVAAYRRRIQDDSHRHVHGANLGVRGDVYGEVGGFRAISVHEDVDLIRRLESGGASIVRTVTSPVLTSARTVGRLEGGVASDLAVDSTS